MQKVNTPTFHDCITVFTRFYKHANAKIKHRQKLRISGAFFYSKYVLAVLEVSACSRLNVHRLVERIVIRIRKPSHLVNSRELLTIRGKV